MKNVERHTHQLKGCAPTPLAHYLKALGVLRLVSEQADRSAQGWWRGDVFYLSTTLDDEALCRFFLEEYCPTPLVGPWGARSGFFAGTSEKSAREALTAIEKSGLPRLKPFSEAIGAVRAVLKRTNLDNKADTPEDKRRLMMQCRAMLADELLPWLDATFMLLETETKYPPLLGTGGNEGSGSYMSGFAQQTAAVILQRKWDHTLRPALFGTAGSGIACTQTPGHFSPEAAGGANSASSDEGGVVTNPWDYLLLLEGTLLFAAASVRRLEQRDGGTLGYPFCVRQAGVGYGSAAGSDEETSRAEMWLPLWSRPSSVAELSGLFSEGRAQVCGRSARNGVDFARALAGLGTDRGIGEFQRFAFQQRNGLSYFAVPLGRFKVQTQPQVNLLAEIDAWMDSFRRAASSDKAPSRGQRALRRLESAIFELCRRKDKNLLQAVLMALGEAEQVLALSKKWREDQFQRPVPLLSLAWLTECDDSTPEFRLAASLAALYSPAIGDMRQHLVPVRPVRVGRWPEWSEDSAANCNVVWTEGALDENLLAVLQRRSIEAARHGDRGGDNILVFPGDSGLHATLDDVCTFLRGETDDERIAGLLRGLTLLDWSRIKGEKVVLGKTGTGDMQPDATFALLKLCHSPHPVCDIHVPLNAAIARLAAAGRMSEATALAARRLRGSGLPPAIDFAARTGVQARRIAAALLIPINWKDLQQLAKSVLKPEVMTN